MNIEVTNVEVTNVEVTNVEVTNVEVTNEVKSPRVGRFAEIGAVVVEWGSEAHQAMVHSALRHVVNRHAGQTPSEGQEAIAEDVENLTANSQW